VQVLCADGPAREAVATAAAVRYPLLGDGAQHALDWLLESILPLIRVIRLSREGDEEAAESAFSEFDIDRSLFMDPETDRDERSWWRSRTRVQETPLERKVAFAERLTLGLADDDAFWRSICMYPYVRSILLDERDEPSQKGKPSKLMKASEAGNEARVRELLAMGATVDRVDKAGWTSLRWATRNGHIGCMRALIEVRATVDVADNGGKTSLRHACSKGEADAVRVLLEGGASVNLANKQGETCLMAACEGAHHGLITSLLDAGASVNAAREDGFTALLLACQTGDDAAVSSLLQAGAAPDAVAIFGLTPLVLAQAREEDAIVACLREAGATKETHRLPPGSSCAVPFCTAGVPDAAAREGQVYYEIELIGSGPFPQIGWVPSGWRAKSKTDGVGDDQLSYGADGARHVVWNGGCKLKDPDVGVVFRHRE